MGIYVIAEKQGITQRYVAFDGRTVDTPWVAFQSPNRAALVAKAFELMFENPKRELDVVEL